MRVSWWALSARKDGSLLAVSSCCIVLSDKKRLGMGVWATLCGTERPSLKAISIHQRRSACSPHSGWAPPFQLSSRSGFIRLCSLGLSDARCTFPAVLTIRFHPTLFSGALWCEVQRCFHGRTGSDTAFWLTCRSSERLCKHLAEWNLCLSRAPVWRWDLCLVRRSWRDLCRRVTSEAKQFNSCWEMQEFWWCTQSGTRLKACVCRGLNRRWKSDSDGSRDFKERSDLRSVGLQEGNRKRLLFLSQTQRASVVECFSFIRLCLGFSEPFFQLNPDLWTFVSTWTSPKFSSNSARLVYLEWLTPLSDHGVCLIRLLTPKWWVSPQPAFSRNPISSV